MSRYTRASRALLHSQYPATLPYQEQLASFALQNMMLRQHNFPCDIEPGDHVAEIWSHLLPEGLWTSGINLLRDAHGSGYGLLDRTTPESFVAMCQLLVGRDFSVTGAIAVRFVDVDRGRPLIRLTVVGIYDHTRELFCHNTGPHLNGGAASEFDPICLPEAWAHVLRLIPRKKRQIDAQATSPSLC